LSVSTFTSAIDANYLWSKKYLVKPMESVALQANNKKRKIMFSIFVTLNVKSEYLEEFTNASFGDAQGSVRDESGCFRFDINQDVEIPTRFYLYEVYRDENAFQAHLETPHFKEWISIVKPMFDGETEKVTMKTVFPSDDGWEAQKPSLLNW